MKVCVCGYYYRPEFYRVLKGSGYERFVVGKRPSHFADVVIPNTGLEWAAYDYYVGHVWGGEDVLFTHDDAAIRPAALAKIAALPGDCNMIFVDEDDALDNGGRGWRKVGVHGRAFKLSGKLIGRLGGFWYDEGNTGYVSGPPRAGGQDYNAGVARFYDRLIELGVEVQNAFVPEYHAFRRNQPMREVKRVDGSEKVILNLGCGLRKVPEAVNVDAYEVCAPDVLLDLDEMPWPWPDNSVDMVTAFHLMEHLEDWFGAFKEIARILKVGGTFVMHVPDVTSMDAYGYRDHHYTFTRRSFDDCLLVHKRGTNAWARSQRQLPLVMTRFEKVVDGKYVKWWIPSWFLRFASDHMVNFIHEARFEFTKHRAVGAPTT